MNSWRTTRPNPYRRAIAMAIDLERMHDAMAAIVGHSIPLPDRIVPEGSRRGDRRPLKMRLPGPMTLEAMNDVADRRLAAVSDLANSLRDADPTASGMIDTLLGEAVERTGTEQGFRPAWRRGPSLLIDPDDRLGSDEMLRRDILRAADAPVAPPPVIAAAEPQEVAETRSFSVDLMTEGLLDHYGVDRARLHAELLGHWSTFTKRSSSRTLTSPAMRSNANDAIAALGVDFPRAEFVLRGLSLDVREIEMPIHDDGTAYGVWSYHGGGGGKHLPTLSREDAMHGYDLFDFPRRALRDVTGDIRFHDAIVIDTADRYDVGGHSPRTTLRLWRGYAHIDPPGTGSDRRTRITRASDVRRPQQARAAEHKDLEWSRLIDRLLNEAGHVQRRTIRLREGMGLVLRIADRGRDVLMHTYEIKRDTLDDGEEAVRARVASIAAHLNAHGIHVGGGYGTQSAQRPAHVPANEAPASEGTPDTPTGEAARTLDEVFAEIFGDAQQWRDARKVDDLLADVLSNPTAIEEAPELHSREGILLVNRMQIAPDTIYRVEKFERLMGRPTHVVGVLDISRELPPSVVEALRDGTARQVVKNWPGLAQAQVRKVTRCEGATLVTVRMQLRERP